MARIKINGIDLHYDLQGQKGPWLLLSHSLATDLSLWDAQVAALAGQFRILRFDTRGHGGSSAPTGAYDFPMFTADVLGLMDGLGIERAHFAGISLGGMIGQYLALAAPERIERLVLISTASRYPPETATAWQERIRTVAAAGLAPLVEPTLERWFTPAYRASHPRVMERIGALIGTTPAAGYIGCGHAIPTLNSYPQLSRIFCPTLVITGESDTGTPPALGREIADAIPGARYETIADASHLCCVEQAAACTGLLADFLG